MISQKLIDFVSSLNPTELEETIEKANNSLQLPSEAPENDKMVIINDEGEQELQDIPESAPPIIKITNSTTFADLGFTDGENDKAVFVYLSGKVYCISHTYTQGANHYGKREIIFLDGYGSGNQNARIAFGQTTNKNDTISGLTMDLFSVLPALPSDTTKNYVLKAKSSSGGAYLNIEWVEEV